MPAQSLKNAAVAMAKKDKKPNAKKLQQGNKEAKPQKPKQESQKEVPTPSAANVVSKRAKPAKAGPGVSNAEKKPAPSTPQTIGKQTSRKETSRDVLLREILALGGEEEDFDLIEDVLSESEIDEEAPSKTVAKKKEKKNAGKIGEGNEMSILAELQTFMSKELKIDPAKSKMPEFEDEDVDADEGGKGDDIEGEEEEEQGETADHFDDEDEEDEGAGEEEEHDVAEKYGKEDVGAVRDMVNQMLKGKIVDDKLGKKMAFEPVSQWYTVPLPPVQGTIGGPEDAILAQHERAKKLWEADVQKYEKSKAMSSADRDFVATVLKSGTVTDKVSALTLLIQQSPVHSLALLRDQLVHGMARKKSRREAILAIDSIKDLMISTLLPDRKLRYFRDQPVLSKGVKPLHLVAWYFEDVLKKLYFDFIKLLEELSRDPLLHVKNKMVTYISDLLSSKPEQEQNLLALLVNKLGDQDRKLASKCSHLLSQLLLTHPAMKLVVVKEVERLLFRPGTSDRARYYGVIFLNQIVLSRKEADVGVAGKLVDLYFGLFDELVKRSKNGEGRPKVEKEGEKGKEKARWRDGKKGKGGKGGKKGHGGPKKGKKGEPEKEEEKVDSGPVEVDGIDAKMMAGLLTGVNRAFPFAKIDDEIFNTHINTLFTISHIGTFNTSIQSLLLIFQVQSSRQSLSDRFYRVVYGTLLDPRLFASSKQAMYLNLLYRALKADTSIKRVKAFLKRIVQVCGGAGVPFVCGALWLVGEIMKGRPGLFAMCTMGEEDDDEERFVDVADEEGEGEGEDRQDAKEGAETIGKKADWSEKYDGRKRDPMFANADRTCFWELTQFATHFHPTVSLYARTLLSGSPIAPPPNATNYDPLQNHTLSRFLDRFVFKNPKKVTTPYKGSSLMQPRPMSASAASEKRAEEEGREHLLSGGRKRGIVFQDEEKGGKKVEFDDRPVNSEAWAKLGEEGVPVDEVFFYHYFKEKQARQSKDESKKRKKKVSDDVDILSDADAQDLDMDMDDGDEGELDDDEVWAAMRRSSGFPDGGDDGEEGLGSDEEDDDGEMAAWAAAMGSDDDEGEDEEVEGEDGEGEDIDAEEEDEDGDVEMGGTFANDDDEELGAGGDEALARFFVDDEGDDDEEEEEEEKKPKQGKRKRNLAEKAKAMGYSGTFFDEAAGDGFADADEFAALLDAQDAESGEEEEEEEEKKGRGGPKSLGKGGKGPVGGKRKRGGAPQEARNGKKVRRR
ncbi:hypothetical protein HK104_010981 [Borealophlyctis nickersoniae]|nr:hypothetical protein HK104_010981 [Borealophlyctis nickersoniae]